MFESETKISNYITPVRTNLYLGPVDIWATRRKIKNINELYLHPTNFDSILKTHLERVQKNGGKELIFLDIGSGEGCLLDNLSKGQGVNQSIQFLSNNPDFKITAIGLTDAPDPSHQGQVARTYESKDKQITAINYFYSLHRSQPLSSFLNGIGIDRVDLVFGIESFHYFNTTVFHEVIKTIIDYLSPEGQLICIRYYGNPPGFMPQQRGFNYQNSKGDLKLWQELIRQTSIFKIKDKEEILDGLSVREIQDTLEQAQNLYIHLGVLDNDLIEKSKVKIEEIYRGYASEEKIKRFARILNPAFNRWREKKIFQERDKKLNILNNIPNTDLIWLDDDHRNFVLTKKNKAKIQNSA
jgi:hypothetical protein